MGDFMSNSERAIAISKEMAELMGVPAGNPNVHLSMIAGLMSGYLDKVTREGKMLPDDQATEIFDAIYLILADYNQIKLEEGLNDA